MKQKTRKRGTRFLALLLSVLMMTSLLPAGALAADVDTVGQETVADISEPEPAETVTGDEAETEEKNQKDEESKEESEISDKEDQGEDLEDPVEEDTDAQQDADELVTSDVKSPVSEYAGDTVFEIKINEAAIVGNVTLQNTEYPLYKLEVDGSKYDTIRMLKETGTVTVSGADKKFPSTAHIADTNGGIGNLPVDIITNDDNYTLAKNYYTTKLNASDIKLTDGAKLDESNTLLLFRLRYGTGRNAKNCAFLVISWSKTNAVDKNTLNTLLDAISKFSDKDYYTADDRYNGKATSEIVFWTEMQSALTMAKEVAESVSTTQSQIDATVADLTAAIAKLIPATQLNATALYEAVQKYTGTDGSNRYSEESLKNKTAPTRAAFESARDAAVAYLSELFDENGEATAENVAANQSKADGYVAAVDEAAAALADKVNSYVRPDSENAVAGIRLYSKLYDPAKLNESDYTADSWSTFMAAYDAAQDTVKQYPSFNTEMPDTVVTEQTEAFRNLRSACHGLVETKSQITVTISLTDKYAVQKNASNIATATSQVTLTPGATVGDALAALGVTAPSTGGFVDACAYINGIQCYTIASSGLNGGAVSESSTYRKLGLHDGDEVVISRIAPMTYSNISELDTPCAPNMVLEYLKHQRMTTSLTDNHVKAGESFTVTVTAANAMPALYTGSYAPVSGAALYMGEASDDQSAAGKAPVTTNLQTVTNADGQATVTLYESGWCLLYAYDMDGYGTYTNGAATMIYVEPADDLDALRQQLVSELTAVAEDENYPENYFTAEDWTAIQTAYSTALESIRTAEDAGTARKAQLDAMSVIRSKQSAADTYNVSNLAYFRQDLNALPELEKLDKSAEDTIKRMIRRYENMTGYQHSQLMTVEISRYEAYKDAYEKGLDPAKQYALKVAYDLSAVPEADRAGLEAMIQWLKENTTRDGWNGDLLGNTQMAELFTFNDVQKSLYNVNYTQTSSAEAGSDIYFCTNPAYAAFMHMKAGRTKDRDGNTITDTMASYPLTVAGNEYAIGQGAWQIEDMQAQGKTSVSTDGLCYTVNGNSYILSDITYTGVAENDIRDWAFDVFDFSNYMGRNEIGTTGYIAYNITHSFQRIVMPYSDVTVTVHWTPAETDDGLADAQQRALEQLNTMRNALTGDGVEQAYNDGVKAIQAAATTAAVERAYQAAVTAMREAATGYGKVQVIVENTTCSKENGAPWEGTLVDEWIDLKADSTMMSCIVEALEKNGYSQTGAENNYISSIEGLGEFSGGDQSGWMGTLNDWFTNYGFGEFTVAGGTLGDGDVIRVMYTTNGYGEDLGGTWGNSDTTLKDLTVEGGKLEGGFASGEPGGTSEFTLTIDGESSSLKLTPTAANKNYLTKIFLNEKVTTDEEGSSFYKRTQAIPVKNGDTIYIGCGELAWPSMNKQETEARDYTGTWYVLHVVSADSGSDYVNALINALPDASEVSYDNYQKNAEAAASVRTAYKALSKTEQDKVDTTKLEKLEVAIDRFKAIDDVKSKIDALPEAGKVTLAERDAVKAAQDACDALTAEQKDYLTIAQADKIAALSKRIAELEAAPIQAVEELINAIGKVTRNSKDAIKSARKAYDELTEDQQKLVSNYETLTAAEAAYARLTHSKSSSHGSSTDTGNTNTVTVQNVVDPVTAAADAGSTVKHQKASDPVTNGTDADDSAAHQDTEPDMDTEPETPQAEPSTDQSTDQDTADSAGLSESENTDDAGIAGYAVIIILLIAIIGAGILFFYKKKKTEEES